MKMYQATSTIEAEFLRKCSHCAHEWTVKDQILGGSGLVYGRSNAQQLAQAGAKENVQAFNRDNEVLCPQCGHFSTFAMLFHFPDGFGPALIKRYEKGCLRMTVSLYGLLGAAAALVGAYFILKGDNGFFAKIIGAVLGLAGAATIFMSIQLAVKGISGWMRRNRIKEAIRNASEDQLLEVARAAYKSSGNTLTKKGEEFQEDKWVKAVRDFVRGKDTGSLVGQKKQVENLQPAEGQTDMDMGPRTEVVCGECQHFVESSKVCTRFHFNLKSSPNQYYKKCNGKFLVRRTESV